MTAGPLDIYFGMTQGVSTYVLHMYYCTGLRVCVRVCGILLCDKRDSLLLLWLRLHRIYKQLPCLEVDISLLSCLDNYLSLIPSLSTSIFLSLAPSLNISLSDRLYIHLLSPSVPSLSFPLLSYPLRVGGCSVQGIWRGSDSVKLQDRIWR